MAAPTGYKIHDVGLSVDEVFRRPARIKWEKSQIVNLENPPLCDLGNAPGCLYVLLRDHHRSKVKGKIIYVGITKNPKVRFRNHPVYSELAEMRGQTSISFGHVDFSGARKPLSDMKAMEQLEHILIWALWPTLINESKQWALPGTGKHGFQPWHIVNQGFRFSGQMPQEILYPWMLVKSGRNRSNKENLTRTSEKNSENPSISPAGTAASPS